MAVQRRIIWLDDIEWQDLTDKAAEKGMTRSRYIAWSLGWKEALQKNMALGGPGGEGLSQAQRDAILRKMSKTK